MLCSQVRRIKRVSRRLDSVRLSRPRASIGVRQQVVKWPRQVALPSTVGHTGDGTNRLMMSCPVGCLLTAGSVAGLN